MKFNFRRMNACSPVSLLLLLLATLTPAIRAQTGTLTGTVQTTDKQSVPNAFVVISALPVGSPMNVTPFMATVYTDSAGKFSLPGVPAGSFSVCPQLANSDLLSPCAFLGKAPVAVVAAGQTVSMDAIQLKTGARVKIRINDPSGKRAAMEGTVAGAALSVAVGASGIAGSPAIQVHKDNNGADHEVVIPWDTDLIVTVSSKAFAIQDAAGAAVDKDKGGSYPIKADSGKVAPSMTFSVTGTNP